MGNDAAAFHQYCQRITNSEPGGTSAAQSLGELVADTMPQEYHIPYEQAENTISLLSDQKNKQIRGLWHELVQHLTDLGYLSERDFMAYHQASHSEQESLDHIRPILTATSIYLAEEDWTGYESPLFTDEEPLTWQSLEENISLIVERIAAYTAFDGSLPPPLAYQIGEHSPYGRALAFRMRNLIHFDQRVANTFIFDQSLLGNLFNLDQILKLQILDRDIILDTQTLPKKIWAVSGDISLLYERFIRAQAQDLRKGAVALSYRLSDLSEIDPPEAHQHVKKRLLKKPKTQKLIKAGRVAADEGYNQLGIRLLQIRLWQTNFYVGAIDGDWGKTSHKALVALLDCEWEHADKKNTQKNIATTLVPDQNDKKTFVVNLTQVRHWLKNYEDQNRQEAKEDEAELLDDIRKEVAEDELDDRLLNERLGQDLYPDAVSQPKRRVNYPKKRFLAGIRRGFKRIIGWIKKAVKKLLGPVFGFVKMMLRRIRMGISHFFQGFRYFAHFILGHPIVTVSPPHEAGEQAAYYMTKFSLDFDAVNVAPPNPQPEGIQRHTEHIRTMKERMFYFIDVVMFIVKAIGKLSTPGGWVWLGIQILKCIGIYLPLGMIKKVV